MSTREQNLELARRMMREGATAKNAAEFAGVPVSELEGRRSSSSSSSSSRSSGPSLPSLRRVRRATGSFGSLVAQALLLVALYWILRAPNAVARVTDAVASGLRWIREPVPIGG